MYDSAQTSRRAGRSLAVHPEEDSTMIGKYVLHPAGTEQFHWDLKAGNAETILSSQMYTAKQNAETGIESCRNNSSDDARYSRLVSKDTKPYFVLKAGNGEVIGTSQMYSSESARDHGIASCKENGPSAKTQDDTK
jgi:uncharacterized protein YegP (UPF0339 family)